MAYTNMQRGSGFVGLRDYLGLNRQKGEEMGNRLAGRVEGNASRARGAVDAAQAEALGKVEEGTPKYTEVPYGYDAAEADAWRASPIGPTAPKYTGPKEMGDVVDATRMGELDKGLADAERSARYGATDAGRAVLLGEEYGGPTTQGGRMLDASLAGRGAAGERLQAAASGAGKLREYLGLAKTNTANAIASAEGRAKQLADAEAARLGARPKSAPPGSTTVNKVQAPPSPIGTHPGSGEPVGQNGKQMTMADGTKKWVPFILNEQGIYVPDPRYYP